MSINFPAGSKVSDRKVTDSWIRGRFEGNLRMERGSIDTTGPSIVTGVGFTVVKNGTGDVTVTFDPPFSATMSIVSTAIGSTVIVWTVTRTASTANLVRNRV